MRKIFAWVLGLALLGGTALAVPAIYTDQGGKVMHVKTGGSIQIETGGKVDVKSGGGLEIAGTAVTSSAAELNLADGSVAGTAVANKLLALGANKNVDVLAVADLKLGAGAGTSVTSDAEELNLLDGSMAGTAVASKALVAGSGLTFPTGLKLNVVSKAADFAPNATDSGTVYMITGGSGVTVTMPPVSAGLFYTVCNGVNQNLTISASPDLLVALNNASASAVALSTVAEKIGGCIDMISNSVSWVAAPRLEETQTLTVID